MSKSYPHPHPTVGYPRTSIGCPQNPTIIRTSIKFAKLTYFGTSCDLYTADQALFFHSHYRCMSTIWLLVVEACTDSPWAGSRIVRFVRSANPFCPLQYGGEVSNSTPWDSRCVPIGKYSLPLSVRNLLIRAPNCRCTQASNCRNLDSASCNILLVTGYIT